MAGNTSEVGMARNTLEAGRARNTLEAGNMPEAVPGPHTVLADKHKERRAEQPPGYSLAL